MENAEKTDQEKLEEDFRNNGYLDDDSNESPPSDIVAYNELRSCADLYRMHNQGVLKIQPDFQRDFIWNGTAQTRFIDSVVKQLPIPSMCFAFDFKKNEWQVIDGLQRISTIIKFLDLDEPWKLSNLDDIDPRISGKQTTSKKKVGTSLMPRFHSIVENTSIPVNVLRCDFSKKTHMEYLFTIFHRLNSGGQKLNNQEIRNCIFSGSLNKLLRDLDRDKSWREINNMKAGKNLRFVKQELILRVFAFSEELSKYEGNIARFLNNYMHTHRNAETGFIESHRESFANAVNLFHGNCFDKNDKQYPIAVLEATLVAILLNYEKLNNETKSSIQVKWKRLLKADEFSPESLKEGLSKKERVRARILKATEIFGQ